MITKFQIEKEFVYASKLLWEVFDPKSPNWDLSLKWCWRTIIRP
jgi:hypothetical protein